MDCPRDDDYALWLDLLDVQASERLLDALGDFLAEYLRSSGRKLYVLGLSGGLDSSFLAALLYSRRVPYLGFVLPVASDAPEEMTRALRVCQAYAHPPASIRLPCRHDLTHLYIDISTAFSQISPHTSALAEGNIKARIRMLFLYHMAHVYSGCVLGTDQLDELLTGFWTLHGDVGDVGPIQLIPKTTEYELARLLCKRLEDSGPLQAAIEAVPTDGLGISASDLEQLEVESYARLEELFREYFKLCLKERRQGLEPQECRRRAELEASGPVRRFLQSGYKRRGAIMADPRITPVEKLTHGQAVQKFF
jgi:NAD+ synthetase